VVAPSDSGGRGCGQSMGVRDGVQKKARNPRKLAQMLVSEEFSGDYRDH